MLYYFKQVCSLCVVFTNIFVKKKKKQTFLSAYSLESYE